MPDGAVLSGFKSFKKKSASIYFEVVMLVFFAQVNFLSKLMSSVILWLLDISRCLNLDKVVNTLEDKIRIKYFSQRMEWLDMM